MFGVKKFVFYLLSSLLLASLLVTAISSSVDITLSHPTKVENWLSDSDVYGSYAQNIYKNTQRSLVVDQGSIPPAIQTIIQQTAEATYNKMLIKQDGNIILSSNYAWLQGKTPTPNFSVNLSSTNAAFISSVDQDITAYIAKLPVCTPTQALAIKSILLATCQVPNLPIATAIQTVNHDITSSVQIFTKPVITADNLSSHSKPYYERLSQAPRAYRLALVLPWVFGAISLVLALAILIMAYSRRHGLKRIAVVLLLSGALLAIAKVIGNAIFNRVENSIFNSSSQGDIQRSLINFVHTIESQLVKVDLYIGAGYILLSMLIIVGLLATSQKGKSLITQQYKKSDDPAKAPDPEEIKPANNKKVDAKSSAQKTRSVEVNKKRRKPRIVN